MATIPLPDNLPKIPLHDIRECPIVRHIDDLGIWLRYNAPCIDASNMVMHISDTPSTMFPFLRRTLHRIKPAWIIHTGDIVDDVKLEKRSGLLDLYKKKMRDLLSILNEEDYGTIITPGNHDNVPSLLSERAGTSVQVWTSPGRLSLGNFSFKAGHTFEDVAYEPAQYNLYGHSFDHKSCATEDGRYFLNAMEYIYLIHIYTGAVMAIAYPPGTGSARLDRKSFSI